MNFYDNAVIAMEKLHMQWNVIMDLYFYDFQNILQRYSKILDDRKKDEDEEMNTFEIDKIQSLDCKFPTYFVDGYNR